MRSSKKNLTRVCAPVLLMSVILTFSQCKKESADSPTDLSRIETTSAVSSTSFTTLDLSKAKHDGGFAVNVTNDFGITGDSSSEPNISTLRLFEDGKELGAAHSSHASIRNEGKGKFSHWRTSLRFSSSDNTDPRSNGRKYTWTTGTGTTTGGTTPTPPVTSPVSDQSTAIGFANVNGLTTGGKGGQTVTVSTYAALKSAVASSSPLIIKVSGTISGKGMINVRSNKTIVGLKGAKLTGFGLMLYTVNNVIIQNLIISNVIGGDCITIKESTHHVWVDHCDLSSDRNHGWDYYDGLLDITNKSDYISVSWNKIHESNKAMLVGSGYTTSDDKGKLRVTFYNNYFSNISERTPDAKFGSIHMFNNYFNNAAYVGAFMGATIRLDNNYWQGSSLPVRTDLSSTPGSISGLATNVFNSSKANRITSAASSWVPTYEYKSALIAAAEVPSKITSGAGATL